MGRRRRHGIRGGEGKRISIGRMVVVKEER